MVATIPSTYQNKCHITPDLKDTTRQGATLAVDTNNSSS